MVYNKLQVEDVVKVCELKN